MNSIKLHLMDGGSINHIVDEYTTLYDVIQELPDSNDFIYHVYIKGQENRVNINTLINKLYIDKSDLFLLKMNIPDSLKIIYNNSSYYTNIHEIYYNSSLFIYYPCHCFQPLSDLTHLIKIDIRYSHNTDMTQLRPIQYIVNLESLTLTKCINMSSLDGVQHIKQIKNLNILEAPLLIDISHIECLDKLVYLKLDECHTLTNISYLKQLTQLEEIYLFACINIYNIEALSNLVNLHTIHLYKCISVYDISPLYNMVNVQDLILYNDKECIIGNMEIISTLINIKSLKLQCNSNTNDILYRTQLLGQFKYLETLELYNCNCLKDIRLPVQLKTLFLYKCNFNSLYNFKHIIGLQSLIIILDTSILYDYPLSLVMYNLNFIDCFVNLTNLQLEGLYETDILNITKLQKLKRVQLRNCINLKNLDSVKNMNTSVEVDIVDCYKLRDDDNTMSFIRAEE